MSTSFSQFTCFPKMKPDEKRFPSAWLVIFPRQRHLKGIVAFTRVVASIRNWWSRRQVSLAGKRLSPSDPDRSRPKPRKLQWWDDMRYLWRGKVRLTAHAIDFSLASTGEPQMSETARRMQVQCLHSSCAPVRRWGPGTAAPGG